MAKLSEDQAENIDYDTENVKAYQRFHLKIYHSGQHDNMNHTDYQHGKYKTVMNKIMHYCIDQFFIFQDHNPLVS